MKQVAAKLKLFFSGFGLPAYTLASVPDEVELPYIAYRLIEPEWDKQADTYCQVYFPKNQLEALLTVADQIAAEVGTGLKIILPDGYLMLCCLPYRLQYRLFRWQAGRGIRREGPQAP